jgi:hypothetical protein
MKFDYSLLKSRIKVKGYNCVSLASKLETHPNNLYNKLNNRTPFTQSEMYKLKEILSLESIDTYFFVKTA